MSDKKYTYDEVYQASLNYFNGNDLAAKVFVDKYALKDKNDNYCELTPFDMHNRLAKEFARIEANYINPMSEKEIFDLFDNFRWVVPQGSPMSAIGNPFKLQSAGNCFVIESPTDSYGGICKADQELAQLMKRRAGVGLNISNIRPKGQSTNNAAHTTDGIGVFMERFSNTCREVAQGGRRGALLLAISVHHPEIRTFINIKKDKKKVTGANVSVLLTDEFMAAVEKNEDVQLRWPVDSNDPVVSTNVSAKELWNEIIESAWSSAEPGLLFYDNIKNNSIPHLYKDIDNAFAERATNPCGEIPMGTDSCRLLLLNVFSFVKNPFSNKAEFDFDEFYNKSIKAQRLMDDLVDLELELIDKIIKKIKADPEPANVKKIELDLWKEFKRVCINGRRTGLGVTAVADAIAALNIQYGSDKSVEVIEKIYKTMAMGAHYSSVILAKERGAFPIYDYNLEKKSNCSYLHRIWKENPEIEKMSKKTGRRNIALTTTAPCGTVSMLTQTSSGIEPVFLVKYTRRKKINPSDQDARIDFVDELGDKWQEFDVYHHHFKTWMEVTGKSEIEQSPYFKSTSNDINWVNKVKIQGAAQKWISHAISNTTNLPKEASKELVSQVYLAGYKSGCKGVTVYRDGSRSGVLISEKEKLIDSDGRPTKITVTQSPKRPNELIAEIHNAVVKGVKWTVLIGMLQNEPYELFMGPSDNFKIPTKLTSGKIVKVKGGHYRLLSFSNEIIVDDILSSANSDEGAWITRMMSVALRHGVPIEYLTDQLSKDGSIVDVNNVLARLLKKYVKKRDEKETEKCPQCGSHAIVYEEGCKKCSDCGHSQCG